MMLPHSNGPVCCEFSRRHMFVIVEEVFGFPAVSAPDGFLVPFKNIGDVSSLANHAAQTTRNNLHSVYSQDIFFT